MKPLLLASVKTGRRVACPPKACKLSSTHAPWSHMTVYHVTSIRLGKSAMVPLKHLLVLQLHGAATFHWHSQGLSQRVVQPPGYFSLFPAFSPFSLNIDDPGELLVIALDPQFVGGIARKGSVPRGFQLKPSHGVEDVLVRGIGWALKEEIETDYSGGPVYGKALALALAVQLLRCYSGRTPASLANPAAPGSAAP